jgi:putative membrane protein
MKHLLGIVVSAIALAIAAWVVPGIIVGSYTIGADGHVVPGSVSKGVTLLAVAVIFGVINTVLKPIIKTLGCGFYVLTLGLIAIVVNGLLLWLVSYFAGALKLPFHITGFVAAVEGALIVGIVSWGLHLLLGDRR